VVVLVRGKGPLDALRQLTEIDSEILRLRASLDGTEKVRDVVGVLDLVTSYRERIEQAVNERARVHAYLTPSGWDLPAADTNDAKDANEASDCPCDRATRRVATPTLPDRLNRGLLTRASETVPGICRVELARS
jgi:hypothetical protein